MFRQKARAAGLREHIVIDSARTHDYHPGMPPDAHSQHHALRRVYDLSELRARALREAHIERADFLVVMDELNYSTVRSRMPDGYEHKLRRLTEFCFIDAHQSVREVPDPYYYERADFERVLELAEYGCAGLLAQVRLRDGLRRVARNHHRFPVADASSIWREIRSAFRCSFGVKRPLLRG